MWKPTSVLLKPKVTHEHIPCEKEYFLNHLKSKSLRIVYASSNNSYIRVQDRLGEEWGLVAGQYVINTQIAFKEADTAPKVLLRLKSQTKVRVLREDTDF